MTPTDMHYRTPYNQGPNIRFGPPMTPVVKVLILANIAVYVLQNIIDVSSPIGLKTFWEIFGLTPEDVILKFRIWQPITYLFLHGGVGHLALNMLMLWMFGSELESSWGSRAFLKYYLFCGLGAAVTQGVFDFDSRSIGASGAVFGLLLAYGLVFPRRVILLWLIVPIQARYLVWIGAGIEFLSVTSSQRAGGDGIAHWAHLGGMLFGWLYLRRGGNLRDLVGRLRWRMRRRRFRVIDPRDGNGRDKDRDRPPSPQDPDRWVH